MDNKERAKEAARTLSMRAEIAVAVLEKLTRHLQGTTCGAEPDWNAWPEVSDEIQNLSRAASSAVADLIPCYDELALAEGDD